MDKKEEILINEPEVVETKPSNKVKYAIAIIASTLVLAAVTTLLIGHFKFEWFQSDNYKIDAKINRSVFQANYFSEKRTMTTEITLADGKLEKKEYIIDNNFVVFLTEKKENMNTAALVLLSATATVGEKIHELPHLNILDEEQIKEVEANPDGSKYPLAVFKFDDDGKIEEINLPDNMDEFNAELILDLIEKVIPKLARNRKEDMSNGLDIKTKRSKNKRTIVQSEAPKQFAEFKGSQYSRIVKTEIEDDQITNIKSDSKVHLQSQPEEGQIIYGPKDFKINSKSEISSNEVKYEEKECVGLVNKLASKFTLINSKDLLKSIKDKKGGKKEEKEEEAKPLRNLGNFPITASKNYNIASLDILGQKVTIKYVVGVTSSKATNKLVISSSLGTMEFGNKGCSGDIKDSHDYNLHIFTFTIPVFYFITIDIGCYAKGNLAWEFKFKTGSGIDSQYYASISGYLKLGAEIKAGWDIIASATVFAEGTVFDAKGKLVISQGSVARESSFSLEMGKLVVGIKYCLIYFIKDEYTLTIFDGWKVI